MPASKPILGDVLSTDFGIEFVQVEGNSYPHPLANEIVMAFKKYAQELLALGINRVIDNGASLDMGSEKPDVSLSRLLRIEMEGMPFSHQEAIANVCEKIAQEISSTYYPFQMFWLKSSVVITNDPSAPRLN
jgi:hypothetical protein